MTNDQQLAASYPEQIARIRELCSREFLDAATPEHRSARDTMASGFDWHSTTEGQKFWNELYENGRG